MNETEIVSLSNELIAAVLEEREDHFFTDSDGDLGGWWDDAQFFFFVMGPKDEILNIRVIAQRIFTIEDIPRLYEFCNAWNHDKFWPKAYVHVRDDGKVRIMGETVTDLECGVTLQQLSQLMKCGISTGCGLSNAADELP